MAESIPYQLTSNEAAFESGLRSSIQRFRYFEDESNQRQALVRVPLDDLRAIAQAKYDSSDKPDSASVIKPEHVVKDMLLMELMDWFKNEFFTWTDSPACPRCKLPTTNIGTVAPTPAEMAMSAGRTEIFTCRACFQDNREVVRFPRYNSPVVLLDTRTGRCGEWTNCFALICRAAGFEVRHVHDYTDHVWVEIFSLGLNPNRWVHVDPCENSYDSPLLYETGWGKKLTYIIAVSQDDIQDVTPRYSKDFKTVLSRRNQVRETWLARTIVRLRNELQVNLPQSRKSELLQRWVQETAELMAPKTDVNLKESETVGRESGSLAWRLARQEIGDSVESSATDKGFTWKIGEDSVSNGRFQLFYDCDLDTYLRKNRDGGEVLIKRWENGTNSFEEVFRKEEHDWKTVYLTIRERANAKSAQISWKFEVEPGYSIDDVTVSIKYSMFQSDAKFCLHLITDQTEKKTLLETSVGDQVYTWSSKCSADSNFQSHLERVKTFTITCDLKSGSGNEGWQKVQLFRQQLTDKKSQFNRNIFNIECSVKKIN